jgi:hypothetical protein
MQVQYDWHWSTARDFTASVYSHQALEVKDWRNETFEWYMDGDFPSAFTTSTYTNPAVSEKRVKPGMFGPKRLRDTFKAARDFGHWMELYWTHPWLIFIFVW